MLGNTLQSDDMVVVHAGVATAKDRNDQTTTGRGENDILDSKTTTVDDTSKDVSFTRDTEAEGVSNKVVQSSLDLVDNAQISEYPRPPALWFLTAGIYLTAFIVSVDKTIVATAIPRISDEFHSYADIGWYGSAYLVTACAFQPLYGRVFVNFPIKWSYLVSLAIFELGSLVCGVALNSVTFIMGRAIAGCGSAGIMTGGMVMIANSVPLRKRPIYSGAAGMMFGIGAIAGPLLGGVFTELASWRWCFYFNLPVGLFAAAAAILFFPSKTGVLPNRPFLRRLWDLDLIGNALVLSASVMLFLALQYNGEDHIWSSPRVVSLLVSFGLVLTFFIAWQWNQGDQALVPPKIVLQRNVGVSCIVGFLVNGAIVTHAYYLPIWFQAVKGKSVVDSGVGIIAYMVANVLFSLLAGFVVSAIGYVAPPAIAGAAIGTIGSAFLSTLQVDTPTPRWIGYEVLASAGTGMAIQQSFIAVQITLAIEHVPIGLAVLGFTQNIGSAVFVSVGNNILQSRLISASNGDQIPGIDIHAVIAAGDTPFRSIVPIDALASLLLIYNRALQKVLLTAVPLLGVAFFASLGFERKSLAGRD